MFPRKIFVSIILLLILFSIILVASCSSFTIGQTPTEENPWPTITEIAEIKTSNPLSSSALPDFTLRPINEGCIQIYSEGLETTRLMGELVLNNGILDLSEILFRSMEISPFYHAEVVSPNRELFAAFSENNQELQIIDQAGEQVFKHSISNLAPIYWIDNQTLVLREIDVLKGSAGTKSFIMNIQTGSAEELKFDIEMINVPIDTLGKFWDYANITRTSINNAGTHLVFPRYNLLKSSYEIVLWDIHNNAEVTSYPAFIGLSLPRWNTTGEKFLISGPADFSLNQMATYSEEGNDLYAIDLDGKIDRLSEMAEVSATYQHDYTWSPDNSSIAFSIEYLDQNLFGFQTDSLPIAVLDIKTKNVRNLCIESLSASTWSPDGRYLAILNDVREIIIVDLLENKAYKIYDADEDAYILGWIN